MEVQGFCPTATIYTCVYISFYGNFYLVDLANINRICRPQAS